MKEKIKKEKVTKAGENKKKFSRYYLTCIIETLYIFVIEILFKLLLGSLTFDYSLLRIFLSSAVIAFIVNLITFKLNSKLRKGLLIFFNFFIVFYAWLQLGFDNYLGAFMSIGNAEQGTKITDYVLDFVCSYPLVIHLIYIPFILIVVYFAKENKFTKEYVPDENHPLAFKVIISALYIALLCDLFYMTIDVGFMQNKYQTISNKSLFSYPSNPSMAIKNFGTSIYFALDVKSTILGSPEIVYASSENTEKVESTTRDIDDTAWEELIDSETNSTMNVLNNYFINKSISEKNEYTGLFKDKNVIMIMLESISQVAFEDEYKDYFPTLNKLYNEGITGVNNYSPKNNCATGESEMTSQISIYSIETTCTVNTYKDNVYPEALMSMLSKNGYYTSAYHDYTDKYYSRSTYEYNFGSSKYYGVEELGMTYNSAYKEWPSDKTFMETALPKFINKSKFASFMVTVSAHTPYVYSSEMGDKYLSLFDDLDIDKAAKRYLSKVKVVDTALEYLLETLEEEGVLDDTVLVIFGDHYPYGLSDSEYQSIAPYDISVNQEVDRTPFIIYNSQTEAQKITKYTSPLDYTPTLLNLLGIEYDPRLYFGHDIFSDDYEDFVIFPDNSWQSSKGFYNAARGEFTPNDGVETISDDEIIKLNQEVTTLRNMSALTIKKNYFNYLFDYFEDYEKNTSNTGSEDDEETENAE